MKFEDLYAVPGIGATISEYLTINDDAALDSTSKNIRGIDRSSVYPTVRCIYPDGLRGHGSTLCAFINKVNPYVECIHFTDNFECIAAKNISKMPNLRQLEFVVPIHISNGGINDMTVKLWESINRLFRSLFLHPNKLETLTVVPGDIVVDEDESVPYHRYNLRNVNDHLAIYRARGIGLMSQISLYDIDLETNNHCVLKKLTLPSRMLDWYTEEMILDKKIVKDLNYTDWTSPGLGGLLTIAGILSP